MFMWTWLVTSSNIQQCHFVGQHETVSHSTRTPKTCEFWPGDCDVRFRWIMENEYIPNPLKSSMSYKQATFSGVQRPGMRVECDVHGSLHGPCHWTAKTFCLLLSFFPFCKTYCSPQSPTCWFLHWICHPLAQEHQVVAPITYIQCKLHLHLSSLALSSSLVIPPNSFFLFHSSCSASY